MTGKELFYKYSDSAGKSGEEKEYAKLIFLLGLYLEEDLYRLLEKAEKEGKRLAITPEPEDRLRDELSISDVYLIPYNVR